MDGYWSTGNSFSCRKIHKRSWEKLSYLWSENPSKEALRWVILMLLAWFFSFPLASCPCTQRAGTSFCPGSGWESPFLIPSSTRPTPSPFLLFTFFLRCVNALNRSYLGQSLSLQEGNLHLCSDNLGTAIFPNSGEGSRQRAVLLCSRYVCWSLKAFTLELC